MPRPSPADRLSALAGAATRSFGRVGYRGTLTAEVATDAGMSSGSVFNYVQSKEALFHLVFLAWFSQPLDPLPPLPVATPAPGETVEYLTAQFRKLTSPRMQQALRDDEPIDVDGELRGIIEERYSLVAGLWPILAVIERCAGEIPELEAFYFRRARVSYLKQLERYLGQRASGGHLRTLPDVAVAARIVTETIAWFAWHRHESRDADLYDDGPTMQTAVQFICAALLPDR